MRQGPGVFAPGMPLSSGRGLDGPGAQSVASAAGVQCLLPVYTGDRADGDPGRSRRQCPPGPGAELSHLHSAPARRCAAAQEPEFKREAPRRMTASRDLFTACSRRTSSVNSAWSYAIRAAPARQRHAERRHPLPSARSNPRSSADAGAVVCKRLAIAAAECRSGRCARAIRLAWYDSRRTFTIPWYSPPRMDWPEVHESLAPDQIPPRQPIDNYLSINKKQFICF